MTLSDGSMIVTRTTSPLPVYRCIKDTRNHPLWNPSSQRLANLEEDEAGRLRAFRKRFGRGWDAEAALLERQQDEKGSHDGPGGGGAGGDVVSEGQEEEEEGLLDLISGFQVTPNKNKKKQQGQSSATAKPPIGGKTPKGKK